MHAIDIPKTSPERYISFKHALNLRAPEEDTGEWHFLTAFFDEDGAEQRTAPLAGQDGLVDTRPSLGEVGVRDMAGVLKRQGVTELTGPVYVANHYRAVADLAMLELSRGQTPTIANARAINAWFDMEDQISTLVESYLKPLRLQLNEVSQNVFEAWIATIHFE